MSIVPGCRCAELREVFGSRAAERCGPCAAAARAVELTEAGFVPVLGHARQLGAAGIEQPSVFQDGGFTRYSPQWAINLLGAILRVGFDPTEVLRRANTDEVFRRACESITECGPEMSAQFEHGDGTVIGVDYAADYADRFIGGRLIEFVRAQGIHPEELPEDAEGD